VVCCIGQIGQMVIPLDLAFENTLDPARLARALDLLLDAEPILGSRFVMHPRRPWWERLSRGKREALSVLDSRETYKAFLEDGLDPDAGPRVRAGLLQEKGESRLALKVDHLVCDAAGVKEVARVLSDTYTKLGNEPGFRPKRWAGSRSPRQLNAHLPFRARFFILARALSDLWRNSVPQRSHGFPLSGRSGPTVLIRRELKAPAVKRAADFGRERGATLNDLLIASYLRAALRIHPMEKGAALRLTATADLRRHLPAEAKTGLCNLSGFTYYRIDSGGDDDLAGLLAKVTDRSRRMKTGWIGMNETALALPFGRLLPMAWLAGLFHWAVETGVRMKNLPFGFTNVGPLDPEGLRFDVPPVRAAMVCPPLYAPLFMTGASGYRGALTLSARIQPASWGAVSPEAFFDAWVEELTSL
jgi:NRPS condensation-like uncharacterized protein